MNKLNLANAEKTARGFLVQLRNNPNYWIGAVIGMALLLRISNSPMLNNLVSYAIITVLLNMGFKDWQKSLIYALAIVIVVNIVHRVGMREGFENLEDAIAKLTQLKHSNEDSGKNDKEVDGKNDKKKEEAKGIPVIKIKGKAHAVEEYDQMSDVEKNKLYRGLEKKDGKDGLPKRASAGAQRELFQLIDTVKQLQSTVEELGPTLKEGKKIMDAFENINME